MVSSIPGGGRSDHLKIFFAAGEVSGDRQAAYLAHAILSQNPNVELFGSGGEKMREAGIDIRIQTSHLGSVGFQESIQYLRPLRAILSQLRAMLRAESPDLAVLVDNEGFNGLLAKFLYNVGIPFIYYFPPKVWLWGEWRAKAIAKRATAVIPAFPAEQEIYRREGARVHWFGHPLLDIVKTEGNPDTVLSHEGLDPNRPLLAIMPGSRFQELQELTAAMLGAARIIKEQIPRVQIILPLAAPHLLPALEVEIARAGMTDRVTIINKHVYTCLSRCQVVLLSSGTATVEV
ncbi:MAG: hypothetical protein HYR76_12385, partial [Ignavibacteria bacterium]|nr:hypothetical protein [Ignavibacteria bacterium]